MKQSITLRFGDFDRNANPDIDEDEIEDDYDYDGYESDYYHDLEGDMEVNEDEQH